MSIIEADICRNYRLAKNKNEQIKILAELNDVKPDVILDILIKHGEISGVQPAPAKATVDDGSQGKSLDGFVQFVSSKKRVDWSVMDKEVQRLSREGMRATQIAERLGIDVNKIYDRRKYWKKQADKLVDGGDNSASKDSSLGTTKEVGNGKQGRPIPSFSGNRPTEALSHVVAQLEAMGFAIGCATYDVLKGELLIVGTTREDDKQ